MQPSHLVTRRYFQDAQYTSDAARMAAAGWRVVSIQREPTGAIAATYAPAGGVPAGPRGFLQRHVVAVSVSGGLLIAVVVALVLALLGSVVPTSASTLDATPTATLAPMPTDTPAPAMVTGAQLGGPITDFETRYGSGNSPSPVYQWDTVLDGDYVWIFVTLSRNGESLDDQYRAALIVVSTPLGQGAPWSAKEEAALVSSFLPSDATHTRDVAGLNGVGPDHLYSSALLASSLAASDYVDANGKQLAPGVFSWQCAAQHPYCQISPGTQIE